MRHIVSIFRHLEDRHGAHGDWTLHIEGAAGEVAVAKATGRYWQASVNSFKTGGDVGKLQVRARSDHNYELLVRDDDPDEPPFVLVTGKAPHFWVRGWMYGWDAKRVEWRRNHGNREPAFFVPHEYLLPMEELP